MLATFVSCEGMIGLFPDKHDRLVMDIYAPPLEFETSGHSFIVEVIGYYEPGIDCDNIVPEIENVFFEELYVWMDGKLMKNGYIGPIQKYLHEKYYNLICGV